MAVDQWEGTVKTAGSGMATRSRSPQADLTPAYTIRPQHLRRPGMTVGGVDALACGDTPGKRAEASLEGV